MPVEVVKLVTALTLSERERLACDSLLESLIEALQRRLPQTLELSYLDVGITRKAGAAAPEPERHH